MGRGDISVVLDTDTYRTDDYGAGVRHQAVDALFSGQYSFVNSTSSDFIAEASTGLVMLAPTPSITDDISMEFDAAPAAYPTAEKELVAPVWASFSDTSLNPQGGSLKSGNFLDANTPFLVSVHAWQSLTRTDLLSQAPEIVIQWGNQTLDSSADTIPDFQTGFKLIMHEDPNQSDVVQQWVYNSAGTGYWLNIGSGKLTTESFHEETTVVTQLWFIPLPPNGFIIYRNNDLNSYIVVNQMYRYDSYLGYSTVMTKEWAEMMYANGLTYYIFPSGRLFVGTEPSNKLSLIARLQYSSYPTSFKSLRYYGLFGKYISCDLADIIVDVNRESIATSGVSETQTNQRYMPGIAPNFSGAPIAVYNSSRPELKIEVVMTNEGSEVVVPPFDGFKYTVSMKADPTGRRTPYWHHTDFSAPISETSVEGDKEEADVLQARLEVYKDNPDRKLELVIDATEEVNGVDLAQTYGSKVELPIALEYTRPVEVEPSQNAALVDVTVFAGNSGVHVVNELYGETAVDGTNRDVRFIKLQSRDNWSKLMDAKLYEGIAYDGLVHTEAVKSLARRAGIAYSQMDVDTDPFSFKLPSNPYSDTPSWEPRSDTSVAQFIFDNIAKFTGWEAGFRGNIFYYKEPPSIGEANIGMAGYTALPYGGFYESTQDALDAGGWVSGHLPILDQPVKPTDVINAEDHRNYVAVTGKHRETGIPFIVTDYDLDSIENPSDIHYRGRLVHAGYEIPGYVTTTEANWYAKELLRKLGRIKRQRVISSYYHPSFWVSRVTYSDMPNGSSWPGYCVTKMKRADGNFYFYRITSMLIDFTTRFTEKTNDIWTSHYKCDYTLELMYNLNGEPVSV